jgi:hypothetical protein
MQEQTIAPVPFHFGDVLDAFTLDEQYCYDNKVFAWLRQNAGKKHKEWLCKVPAQNGTYLGYCISIRIKDPAVEIQFRFMHAEHEVKVVRNKDGYLTHVRKQ